MRHTARTAVLVVVVLLVGSACTTTDSVASVPPMTDELSVELQARAFMRACRDAICAGAPILAPDSTPPAVQAAIIEQFTDEVEYVKISQLDERYSADGRFDSGAVMIDVQTVGTTERADVIGVDVWISHGRYEFVGRTYLFLWNGTEWVDTSPDAVDVTVTTSVS